jgi:holo-[acyl-carrier protein] synthase
VSCADGGKLRDASDRQSRSSSNSDVVLTISTTLSVYRIAEGMGIIGIGVDIVHVPRIASLVRRRSPAKFAARILSPTELSEWKTLSPPTTSAPAATARDSDVIATVPDISKRVRFLAVRWAVKEAAYKALFPNYRPTWKDLSVSKEPGNDGGKPQLAFGRFENVRLHVSVSHDGEYIVANVLAED